MAVRALDGAVLVGQAAVVARRGHPVVAAKRLVAPGPVRPRFAVEVAERRGEAVASVLVGRAAETPQRVLEACGQRHEAFPAQHGVDVLEAAEGQAEVVEPVVERHAGHDDAEAGRVGEVRQPQPPGLVALAEDHLPLGPVQRAPSTDAALERPTHAGAEVGVAAHELLEDGHGPQPRRGLEHGHHLLVEDALERVGPAPAARRPRRRGRARVLRDPVARGRAEPGLGRSDGDRVGRTVGHEEPHLVIGHVAAGHGRSSRWRKRPSTRPTAITRRPRLRRRPTRRGPDLRSGYALPSSEAAPRPLILIVARVSSCLPRRTHPKLHLIDGHDLGRDGEGLGFVPSGAVEDEDGGAPGETCRPISARWALIACVFG